MKTAAAMDEHVWRPTHAWAPEVRPRTLWRYVVETGSLTERLRAKAGGSFHVRVLEEGTAPLAAEDAALLSARAGESVFLRQVYLCGSEPLVYARSMAVGEGARWLKELGDNPLGQKVFAEKDVRRSPVEVTHLSPGQPLFDAAVARLGQKPGELWARRSLLTVKGAAILIYECFLPGLA